jgi:Ran GTPase-activating protein (RanGAP) involved in mRNA processing and transport
MSCSKEFGEKYLSQMVNITRLDFSDTIKYKSRSDLAMSTAAMLTNCEKFKITHINMRDNFLDVDGGKAYSEFLWTNSYLKVLDVTNCKMGKRTAELLLEAWEENKSLQIEELYLASNDFDEKSMKVFAKLFANMKSVQVLDISDCLKVDTCKGLKTLLEGMV